MLLAITCLQLAMGPSDGAHAPGEGLPDGALKPGSIQQALTFSAERLNNTALSLPNTLYPKNSSGYAIWTAAPATDWTAGFFPGANWLMYEVTADPAFRTRAESWMVALAGQRFLTTTHDLGFMFTTSFGQGYRLTGNPEHGQVMLDAANSLASRFSPLVGCIESWSWGPWDFPVIIDNLMNLELLFWAAEYGQTPALREIAHTHALTTLVQHVRPDGSTYHLVEFDRVSGQLIGKSSWGGRATESTWARGQAWAVYGFTMCYRETSDPVLLDAAERTADYYLAGLPADSIPYWDFNAENIPNTERDSSAGAVAAAGLLELSTLTQDPVRRQTYFDAAERMLKSLAKPKFRSGYLALGIEGLPLSPGILMHGCSSHSESVSGKNLPDESLIYGDYYFLEALLRYTELAKPHVSAVSGPPKRL